MSEQNQPNLSEVQEAFAQWRASGKTRHTPPGLRAQAVSLLAEHSLSEVMKALRVDHRRLNRWRREWSELTAAAAPSGFVELPSATRLETAMPGPRAVLALTVTRQSADGSAVSIAGELSAEHWGWALGLLQGRSG